MKRDRPPLISSRHLPQFGRWRFLRKVDRFWGGLAIATCLLFLQLLFQLHFPALNLAQSSAPPSLRQSQPVLPLPQVHPLPPALEQWQDTENQGDYFSEVSPTDLGYLVWSRFPVTVYLEPPDDRHSNPIEGTPRRSQAWVEAVTQAVQEWSAYLPLEFVDSSETADISIWRSTPPIQGWRENAPRARSAETRYQIYRVRPANAPAYLSQRFNILLRPGQTDEYIRAAARHELGHALGIWGHSLLETDALYFSQVRHPPPISARDINTLKRIYEQPTRLGWALVPTVRSPLRDLQTKNILLSFPRRRESMD
jgi:predicted Zn-dependent protease